ncbi:hypothetical protein SteCoe_9031 [Stentor coeruleus]|uniref:Uncharacterized protein n=1 Tax=Stentor coeruleus TaxID=5963 RepID=A0A1R2CIZ4_9CILI|nr:hypothetical protein SteCoe_9031 [Stentor coeruleus]
MIRCCKNRCKDPPEYSCSCNYYQVYCSNHKKEHALKNSACKQIFNRDQLEQREQDVKGFLSEIKEKIEGVLNETNIMISKIQEISKKVIKKLKKKQTIIQNMLTDLSLDLSLDRNLREIMESDYENRDKRDFIEIIRNQLGFEYKENYIKDINSEKYLQVNLRLKDLETRLASLEKRVIPEDFNDLDLEEQKTFFEKKKFPELRNFDIEEVQCIKQDYGGKFIFICNIYLDCEI